MDLTSHENELLKTFQIKSETNYKEHSYPFLKFMGIMLLASSLGAVLGGIVEKAIGALQKDTNKNCISFLMLHLTLIAFILYAAVHLYRYFDDWLLATFAGFLFALTFFNVQDSISGNLHCIVNK